MVENFKPGDIVELKPENQRSRPYSARPGTKAKIVELYNTDTFRVVWTDDKNGQRDGDYLISDFKKLRKSLKEMVE